MQDPFIIALNNQRAALGWIDAISINLSNVYTPGYREMKTQFSDYLNGAQLSEAMRKSDQGKSLPGNLPTNLFIEGNGYFVMRKSDGAFRFTRLGDFYFNGDGTLVNGSGDKVQGYLLTEDGKVMNTPDSAPSSAPNNPSHSLGGPSHTPTTEINLWVDPSNGKFFGKYDEYKIESDGTVAGVSDKGKTKTPLYKIALVNFVNPSGLAQVEDQMFVPSKISGDPVAGTGEIRSGLLEKSNVGTKDQVGYFQQAKVLMDISSKLISTNKSLLNEALQLIQ